MNSIDSVPEIGNYTYIGQPNNGCLKGMWQAINKTTNQFYVVNTVNKSDYQSVEQASKFANEIGLYKRTDNKYIAKFTDLLEDQNSYHIITELPQGICLKDYIEKRGPLSETLVRELITKLQTVLLYLQGDLGLNFVVMDPTVIFVDKNGRFSKYFLQLHDSVITTLKDDISYCFIPPEYYSRHVSHATSNSWSVGALGYYTNTGKLPFSGNTKDEFINSVLNHHVLFPGFMSADEKQFITKTLLKNQFMRLKISDFQTTPFMEKAEKEDFLPSLIERRRSLNPLTLSKSMSTFSYLTNQQSTSSANNLPPPKPQVVHLSYMKNSTSRRRFKCLTPLG